MIETVIFDMDGVIIDSEPTHIRIEAQLFEELGLIVSKEQHENYIGMSSLDMWTSLVQERDLKIDPKKIVETKSKRYLDFLYSDNEFQLVEGVSKVIESLHAKGNKLVLASSAAREEIELVLNKSGLKKFFPIVVSGAELERSKPDPLIFITASRLIGTNPQFCCVIEDSENGVIAAKSSNMKCIGYRNPNSGNQDLSKADIIINSFEDFDLSCFPALGKKRFYTE
ncbi:MAG: HAD family phosphatase [Ginsengibacter sp.]